jgi:aryl-alcohol dehydrogenase-like predicted oxidoreductase
MSRRPPVVVAGASVPPIGFGGMPISVAGRPDRSQAIATLHAALDAGVRLVDTADAYCLGSADTGHNEELIAEALRTWDGPRAEVVVATKGGHVRTPDGGWELDGRPEHLRAACEASLRRLEVEAIDLYQYHRPDPRVPFAESVGAIAELQTEGKVRAVGLSNVDIAQIDEARTLVAVASVQNECSPAFRSSLPELEHCAAHGIAFLPWAPLGGAGGAGSLGQRFPAFAQVAEGCGASPQQVALAWLLSKPGTVVPIPGARRVETILDSIAALDLVLTAEELQLLEADAPAGPAPG